MIHKILFLCLIFAICATVAYGTFLLSPIVGILASGAIGYALYKVL